MRQYPYWRDISETKTIEMDLDIISPRTLEDGVYYGSSLRIVDAKGIPVALRTLSQDTKETNLAGRGVYGQFIINQNVTNPCRVTYTPRFLVAGDDVDFAKEQFDYISGVDISGLATNIDDMISAAIPPDDNAILSFGNFDNVTKVSEALVRLSIRMADHFVAIDDLPAAIEEVYLNTRSGMVGHLHAIKDMTIGSIDVNDIDSSSIRILSSPPSEEVMINAIYIAPRAVSFRYNNDDYSVKPGDVCIIKDTEMFIHRFGTIYSDAIASIESAIESMYLYADRNYPELPTVSKNVSEAALEYVESATGYFSDSLYVIGGISSGAILTNFPGTLIASVGADFTHADIEYHENDILVVADDVVVRIGITEEENVLISVASDEMVGLYSTLFDDIAPFVRLTASLGAVENIRVPIKAKNDIALIGNEVRIFGEDISSAVGAQRASDVMNDLNGDKYINAVRATRLNNSLPDVTVVDAVLEDKVRLKELLDTYTTGDFVLSPVKTPSESKMYYNNHPIEIIDNTIRIDEVGVWTIPESGEIQLRFIKNVIYILTSGGIYYIDISNDEFGRATQFDSVYLAVDVVDLNGVATALSYIGGNSILESEVGEYTVSGRVLGTITNTNVVIIEGELETILYNVVLDGTLPVSIVANSVVPLPNGALLMNNSAIVGSISGGEITPFIYDDVTVWDGTEITHSYGGPIMTLPEYNILFKVVLI